jgi:two-component system, response regulator YesN
MYKVLIIDNDKAARYVLKRFSWSRYGFEISDEAVDGPEALAKLDDKKFDLVITDIRMPGMDGMDFLCQVNEKAEAPCLILLSTYNDFAYAQQGIQLGVFDYMTKPLSEKAFGEMLQRAEIYLDKSRQVDRETMHQQKLSADRLEEYLPLARKQQLKDLLFDGGNDFLSAIYSLDKEFSKLDKVSCQRLDARIVEQLHNRLDEKFPWVKNLEADRPEEKELGEKADLPAKAAALLGIVRKYELYDGNSVLRRLCELVWRDVEKNISLGKAAEELHISPDYAGRIFKKKTKQNFNNYVMRTKMERGKILLASGRYKNYEISERLGYSNPDYFRQLFKEYTGMTPTEYRNACRRRMFL